MSIPLTVRFGNSPADDKVTAACQQEVRRLPHRDELRACSVFINRHHDGRLNLRIQVDVNGGDVVVMHTTHPVGATGTSDLAVRDAFDALSRSLRGHSRERGASHATCQTVTGFRRAAAPGGLFLHPQPVGTFPDPATSDAPRSEAGE